MTFDKFRFRRRDVLKLFGAGAASIYVGGCETHSSGHIPMESQFGIGMGSLERLGPIDRTVPEIAPRTFSGDNPSLAHKVLWNKDKFMASLDPKDLVPSEHVKVAVVGGGMSGLLSAYMLRHHEPLVLEQFERFGGNSRGESWDGIDYSLATAYFDIPEKGGAIEKVFKEIGIDGRYRVHDGDDAIFIAGKKYENIWDKGTIPETRHQFRKLKKHFEDVLYEKNGQIYPQIPIVDEKQRPYIDKLDKMTFKHYLEKFLGGPLHPHVEEVMENYFWSASAASYTEISAACGLCFFAGDFDKVAILPGGNAGITEALLVRLFLEVPKKNLRASSLVFNVKAVNDGVHVSYLDPDQKVRTVHAQTVVMSCPKFIAGHLIDDLEPERREVISKLRYRSYLVANVLLKQHLPDNFYDVYFFKGPKEDLTNVPAAAREQGITDVVYGNYAKPDPDRTILTVFRGFPYDDDVRRELLAPTAYDKYRAEFISQINERVLPGFGVNPENVVDIRLARWGHPLPLSEAGNIASKRIDVLRKPFKDRVFFIEQDNWMLPAFETAFGEAAHFTPQVEAVLNGNG